MLFVIAKNRKQFGSPSRGEWLNTSQYIPTTGCNEMLKMDGAEMPGIILTSVMLCERSQTRTSLVVQWLRIRFPMQGTRVLVRELRSHMPQGN